MNSFTRYITRRRLRLWLIPYLEGALDADRTAQFEAGLAADPRLAAELKEMHEVVSDLASSARLLTKTPPTSSHWSAVEARLTSRSQKPASRRRQLTLLAGGMGVAAAACLAVTFVFNDYDTLHDQVTVESPVAPSASVKPLQADRSVPHTQRTARLSLHGASVVKASTPHPAAPSQSRTKGLNLEIAKTPDPFSLPTSALRTKATAVEFSGADEGLAAAQTSMRTTKAMSASAGPSKANYVTSSRTGSPVSASKVNAGANTTDMSINGVVALNSTSGTVAAGTTRLDAASSGTTVSSALGANAPTTETNGNSHSLGRTDFRIPSDNRFFAAIPPLSTDAPAAPSAANEPMDRLAAPPSTPSFISPRTIREFAPRAQRLTADQAVQPNTLPLPQTNSVGVTVTQENTTLALTTVRTGSTVLIDREAALKSLAASPDYGSDAIEQDIASELEEGRAAGELETIRADLDQWRRTTPGQVASVRLLAEVACLQGDSHSLLTLRQQAAAMPTATGEDSFLLGQLDERTGDLSAARLAYANAMSHADFTNGAHRQHATDVIGAAGR